MRYRRFTVTLLDDGDVAVLASHPLEPKQILFTRTPLAGTQKDNLTEALEWLTTTADMEKYGI